MAGPPGRRIRPEQVGEIVAREPPPALHTEPYEEREMLTGAEFYLLTGKGEQQWCPERGQVQVRGQTVISRCYGMVVLGTHINAVSTASHTVC